MPCGCHDEKCVSRGCEVAFGVCRVPLGGYRRRKRGMMSYEDIHELLKPKGSRAKKKVRAYK